MKKMTAAFGGAGGMFGGAKKPGGMFGAAAAAKPAAPSAMFMEAKAANASLPPTSTGFGSSFAEHAAATKLTTAVRGKQGRQKSRLKATAGMDAESRRKMQRSMAPVMSLADQTELGILKEGMDAAPRKEMLQPVASVVSPADQTELREAADSAPRKEMRQWGKEVPLNLEGIASMLRFLRETSATCNSAPGEKRGGGGARGTQHLHSGGPNKEAHLPQQMPQTPWLPLLPRSPRTQQSPRSLKSPRASRSPRRLLPDVPQSTRGLQKAAAPPVGSPAANSAAAAGRLGFGGAEPGSWERQAVTATTRGSPATRTPAHTSTDRRLGARHLRPCASQLPATSTTCPPAPPALPHTASFPCRPLMSLSLS
jgi:hypothetical protein